MKNWHSETHRCLIIKTKALGEKDKMVVAISQERGRFVGIAKGARQMHSSKRACLESGNLAQLYLVSNGTSGGNGAWPIVTQTKIIADCGEIRENLGKIKQLLQFLEILDRVLVEEEIEPRLMNQIELIREMIVGQKHSAGQIRTQLEKLIGNLGFATEDKQAAGGILEFVAGLTNQKMKSYSYLTVQ